MERSGASRRSFLAWAGLGAAGGAAWGGLHGSLAASPGADDSPATHPEFPAQNPALVRETVAVSHGNFPRVRELVQASPALAKANWDWGFGDWESALGAASHTGNRDIALFLIEHGARANIFSAAMLGQLEVVQAFVKAAPGIQKTPGPHGITLLAHARAGGEAASEVHKYLESLGDADPMARSMPLSDAEKAAYVGSYAFGTGPRDWLEVFEGKTALMIKRGEDGTQRGLIHLGQSAFHPAGAPAVRISFTVEGDRATILTVSDPAPGLVARRRS